MPRLLFSSESATGLKSAETLDHILCAVNCLKMLKYYSQTAGLRGVRTSVCSQIGVHVRKSIASAGTTASQEGAGAGGAYPSMYK